MGFKLNPYDRCVANKEIEGSQCTIVYYIDDNKISDKNLKLVYSIIKKLSNEFGSVTNTRGKEHDF